MAAALPMAVALVAMIGTFLALFLVALVTDVSVFSINLTTALGLGLSIDYSLFIVNRFREELRAGRSTEAALVRTMETAGRTVAFSALTVAASLAALLVFPLYFLRSFAYAGTAVVVARGRRVAAHAAGAARRRRAADRRGADRPAPARARADEGAFWHRLATTVMRRPVPVATAVVALLLVLATPFLRVDWGLPSYLALPASSRGPPDVRPPDPRVRRQPRRPVQHRGDRRPSPDGAALERFRAEVEDVDGVASATLQRNEAGTWVTVVPDVVLRSADGEALVHDIRDVDAAVRVRGHRTGRRARRHEGGDLRTAAGRAGDHRRGHVPAAVRRLRQRARPR